MTRVLLMRRRSIRRATETSRSDNRGPELWSSPKVLDIEANLLCDGRGMIYLKGRPADNFALSL